MPTPSLILVPARFKTGKLYTPLATTSGGLVLGASGDFNVTRATTATRFNSAGLIESVASGIPRLDYYTSGGTAGCPALLVEPSAVNSVLQSAAWNVSPWAATSGSQGATVSGNVTASPDGTTNADKLIEAAVTGNHFCLQSLTLTSGTTYTASFFVKASERTRGRLRTSGSGVYWDMDFNLTSGTVTGGTNPFIQNFGNGWYRIGATFTANQASNNFILFLYDASGNVSYTGDGTSGLFVFGAQIEVGSVPTSYIPTTTGSVTRNEEVISVTGAVSGCIGQTQGTIYAEVDMRNLGVGVSIINIQTSSYLSGAVRIDTTALNQLRIQIRDASGNNRLDNTITTTALSTGINKIALGYSSDASGVVTALNGTIINTTTVSASFGTLGSNRVYLGTRDLSGFLDLFINNRIRAVALYTTRLTNAQLAALTTL
jgi:hypothetical protein